MKLFEFIDNEINSFINESQTFNFDKYKREIFRFIDKIKSGKKLSEFDKDVKLYAKIMKLQEEAGEVSQEFLKFENHNNASKSATGDIKTLIEETCDVINVSVDILISLSRLTEFKELNDENFISNEFNRKLRKWESKITK